jgi:hypothetical protein
MRKGRVIPRERTADFQSFVVWRGLVGDAKFWVEASNASADPGTRKPNATLEQPESSASYFSSLRIERNCFIAGERTLFFL